MDQFNAVAFSSSGSERSSSRHQTFQGRVVVVGDASTTLGAGVAAELLKEGATVVAPLRDEGLVERLLADCTGLSTELLFPVVADVADEAECATFVADVLEKHGQINHAVSVFGGFWEGGPLTDQPVEELQRVLRDSSFKHFVFARNVLPALMNSPGCSYLFVTEGAGQAPLSPDTSLYTVSAATTFGIVLAAQDQFSDKLFRVNEMRLFMMIKKHSDIRGGNFQEFYGRKAYSNRKVGKLVGEALLASKKSERIVVTPAMLDGATLTV